MSRSALAASARRTAFVSRISADANGEALAAALADDGVDLSFVARDARPSTLAFVMRGTAKTGSRYSFYLDATAFDGPWPFPDVWPHGARHLHVGSIAAVDPRHGESRRRGAGSRARAGDDQLRSQHPPAGDARIAKAVATLVERQVCARALSSRRARKTSSGSIPAARSRRASPPGRKLGPRFCVATLGERGARRLLGRRAARGRRRRVVDVVDTVGAGDSFMSALLSAMDRDARLARPRAPPSAPTSNDG